MRRRRGKCGRYGGTPRTRDIDHRQGRHAMPRRRRILGRLGEEGVDLDGLPSMTRRRPERPSSSRHTIATPPSSPIAAPTRDSKPPIFRHEAFAGQRSGLRRQSQQSSRRIVIPHRRAREGGQRATRGQSGRASAHRAFRRLLEQPRKYRHSLHQPAGSSNIDAPAPAIVRRGRRAVNCQKRRADTAACQAWPAQRRVRNELW